MHILFGCQTKTMWSWNMYFVYDQIKRQTNFITFRYNRLTENKLSQQLFSILLISIALKNDV